MGLALNAEVVVGCHRWQDVFAVGVSYSEGEGIGEACSLAPKRRFQLRHSL